MPLPQQHMPHTAMVFAAGLGKRLRPLTETCPKPLVEVAGRTLIDRALDRLEAAGVARAVVNTHHLAARVEAHLAQRLAPEIIVSREDSLMETGGGIVRALPLLGRDPFFAVNSDVILLDGPSPTLRRLADAWDGEALDALLLLHPVARATGYDGRGDFFADSRGYLRPRREHEVAPFVFTGVQILHPRLFADSPGTPFSLSLLFAKLARGGGGPPRIRAITHEGEWLHVGDEKGLRLAMRRLPELENSRYLREC